MKLSVWLVPTKKIKLKRHLGNQAKIPWRDADIFPQFMQVYNVVCVIECTDDCVLGVATFTGDNRHLQAEGYFRRLLEEHGVELPEHNITAALANGTCRILGDSYCIHIVESV